MNSLLLPVPFQPVFHIYNRSNDRRTLYGDHWSYVNFLQRIKKNFADCAHLLGYCLMPNHFHLLMSPIGITTAELRFDGKRLASMPNAAMSEAVRRTLMGHTKLHNYRVNTTGSRYQQHTSCKYHPGPLAYGLNYLHFNPVEARLADHPSEWGYSSFAEYAGLLTSEDHICNIKLAGELLYPDHPPLKW